MSAPGPDNGDGAPRRQLARPGDEVGVDVGLDRVGELQAALRGERRVLVDVPPGIDDDRLARCDRTRAG